MMRHADARERLELAAAEPGGLDRLMAGDTADAAALAGHLAGCSSCLEELARLRRATAILRETLAFEPPAELRERTLALVREVGVQRGAGRAAALPVGAVTASTPIGGMESHPPVVETAPTGRPESLARRRSLRRPAAWAASLAAAIVLSSVATLTLVGSRPNEEANALAQVASWNVGIADTPDGRRLALQAVPGSGAESARGELSFAPSTTALVVVVKGLAAPAAGREYRCWIEAPGGARTRVGRMDFANGIAYWVGDVPAIAAAAPGSRFGISLVDPNGDPAGASVLVAGL
jgi:hypothetical protein